MLYALSFVETLIVNDDGQLYVLSAGVKDRPLVKRNEMVKADRLIMR